MSATKIRKNFYTIKELMEIRGVKDRQSVHDWLKRNNVSTQKLDGNIVIVLKSHLTLLFKAQGSNELKVD
jgi:hypothetical protein